MNKYGVEYPQQSKNVRNKGKITNIAKYGVEYTFQNKEIKDKIKATNIHKYGVENPQQSQELQEKTQKNAKKYKEYKFPSGQVRKVQGYEPFAFNELLKTYTEDQIKSERKDIPRILYKVGDISKYYFPDIFIPAENKIIEVKSTWTYSCKIDNIKEKAAATKLLGYNYEIWIFDKKGKRVETPD